MKPNQIVNKLLGCFKTNIDPLTVERGITVIPWLKGGVGVGKTAVVRESAKLIADDQGLEFVDLHQQKAFGFGWRDLTDEQFGFLSFNVSNYDVLDIGGYPLVDKDEQVLRRVLLDVLPRSGKGILFLDELAQCPPSVQKIIQRLLDEGVIGEYTLAGHNRVDPEKKLGHWSVVIASNRKQDGAVVNAIPTSTLTRVHNFEFESDVGDWLEYAEKKKFDPRVTHFIRAFPDLLNTFDPKDRDAPNYATPRTVEILDTELQTGFFDKIKDTGELLQSLGGLVGRLFAQEFTLFLQTFEDLAGINVKEVLSNPEVAQLPTFENEFQHGVAFAITSALVSATKSKTHFENAVTYLKRFSAEEDSEVREGSPEFLGFYITLSVQKNAKLKETKAFNKYQAQYNEVL